MNSTTETNHRYAFRTAQSGTFLRMMDPMGAALVYARCVTAASPATGTIIVDTGDQWHELTAEDFDRLCALRMDA